MEKEPTIGDTLSSRGVSRREFVKFCGLISATLGLPTQSTRVIAQALVATSRLPVIWLEFQDCTGDLKFFHSGLPAPRSGNIGHQ